MSSSSQDLLPVGDLLEKAWEVYKDRFWTLVTIIAIPVVANFILSAVLIVGGLLSMKFLSEMGSGGMVIGIVFAILAVAWFLLLGIWPFVALLYAIKERERKIDLIKSFKKAWPDILSYFWITFLSGLAVMGGLILFVIPGIIFAVWFSLAVYILVAEGTKGTGALKKSKELVSGHWWSVVGRISLLWFIIFGIGILLAFIPVVGQFVANILLTPFSAVFLYLLYENLKKVEGSVASKEPQQPELQRE